MREYLGIDISDYDYDDAMDALEEAKYARELRVGHLQEALAWALSKAFKKR